MSELSNSCPTCFEGRCPTINTTPDVPEPDDARINAAMRVIPDILVEHFQRDGRYETTASRLVEFLREPENGRHHTAAAKWAIHRFIQNGALTVHEGSTFPYARSAALERPKKTFENKRLRHEKQPAAPRRPRIYDKAPAPFDTFDVRAEESLWRWWREETNKIEGIEKPSTAATMPAQAPSFKVAAPPILSSDARDDATGTSKTYLTKELCEELGISNPTLQKYADQADIEKTSVGRRNRRYTQIERLLICKAMAANAPSAADKKRAKDILENSPEALGYQN